MKTQIVDWYLPFSDCLTVLFPSSLGDDFEGERRRRWITDWLIHSVWQMTRIHPTLTGMGRLRFDWFHRHRNETKGRSRSSIWSSPFCCREVNNLLLSCKLFGKSKHWAIVVWLHVVRNTQCEIMNRFVSRVEASRGESTRIDSTRIDRKGKMMRLLWIARKPWILFKEKILNYLRLKPMYCLCLP